jgi:hypothetical protein
MSDADLAKALHSKYYSDIPEEQFNQKIGLSETYGQKVSKAGEAFDKVAGKGLAGAGNALGGALEVGEHMATSVAGDIAGAATSIATQNPKKGAAVRQKVSDFGAPTTESGKAAENYVGAITEPVGTVLDKPIKALEKSGHPILAQTAKAAEDVLPLKVPKVVRGVKSVAGDIAKAGEETASRTAEEVADRNSLIGDVRKLGLKLTSQDTGRPVGKYVEGVAGRPQLEREISQANAPRVKKAAADDVGIKEPLSAGSVNKEITKTISSYTAPRKLGKVNLAADTQWKDKLKEVKGITSQEEIDFPEDVNESVNKEVAKFDKPSADADTLVTKIAKLRERASDNFRGNADDKALARAQRAIATAMEEALERHAKSIGQEGVMKQFKADREKLAKLYTIRDALTESGELDLGELEKRLNNKEPLTGNLRTLARAKSAFDRSFQNPDNIRGHPLGLADVVMGTMAGGAKGAMAGGVEGSVAGAVALGARPATRALLKSSAYQKAFIKPRTPKPSAVSRVARRVAGKQSPNIIKDIPKERKEPTLGDVSNITASKKTPNIINLSGMGKAIGENLREGLWRSYQNGSTKMAGIEDPILKAAFSRKFMSKAEFDKFIDEYSKNKP